MHGFGVSAGRQKRAQTCRVWRRPGGEGNVAAGIAHFRPEDLHGYRQIAWRPDCLPYVSGLTSV
jgi:hypothetical protein